jgi:integrase
MVSSVEKGLRRRGNSYQVDVTCKGKRLTATCKTLEGARRKRAELQHKLYSDEGSLEALKKRGKSWNLAEAVEYTSRVAWAKSVSGKKMTKIALEAVDFFGKRRPLHSITTQAIDQWVFELEARRLSDASINHRIAALSKIMNVALDRGGLDARPKMPRKRQYQTRFRIVSVKEEITMVAHLRQFGFDAQADAVEVLADTGMRVGELLKLREKDIDTSSNMIHIWQTKTQAPRTVLMTKRVWNRIRARFSGHPTRRIFPLTHYDLYKAWERGKAKMALDEDRFFTLNSLRHTCASRIVQRGFNLLVLQAWMGHKSYRSTLRYAHLAPENLDQAQSALESFSSKLA